MKVFLVGRIAVEAEGVVIDERHFPGGRAASSSPISSPGTDDRCRGTSSRTCLWGDAPPATWDKALSVLVSKLRGVLAESGIDGARALTAAFGCYRLDLPEGTWVDVLAAESAAKEAEGFLAADEWKSGDRRGRAGRIRDAQSLPARRRRAVGGGETARACRGTRPGAERAGRGEPPHGQTGGGRPMGGAGDRGRAVPRERIPAPDGGARRRGQPRGGSTGCTSGAGDSSRRSSAPTRRPRPSRSTAACSRRRPAGLRRWPRTRRHRRERPPPPRERRNRPAFAAATLVVLVAAGTAIAIAATRNDRSSAIPAPPRVALVLPKSPPWSNDPSWASTKTRSKPRELRTA